MKYSWLVSILLLTSLSTTIAGGRDRVCKTFVIGREQKRTVTITANAKISKDAKESTDHDENTVDGCGGIGDGGGRSGCAAECGECD
jgi:hypothetical protein